MFLACTVFLFLSSGVESNKDQVPLDDEGYIEKPCRIYDVNCIRQFFAEHSRCNITYGPVPDPLYDPTYTLYLPRINVTLTSLKVEYRGLNGKIVEFYINPKTDKLVLSVNFEGLSFGSNDNYFQFARVGREPLVTNTFLNVSYTIVSSTITIPNLKDLQLQNSEVFSFSDTPDVPIFDVGPKAFGDDYNPVLEYPLS
ncbi:fibrohexamerin-like [Danaus plexippus]|uniref:fibrohexamerin-like n=1 Tax=Danaus plexippus TaxID=13037 RepID=UPI002AAF5DAB|nr:fibrohexamerin-like [Danaus plexippus]